MKQLLKDGIGYLGDFWNYIDLIPPFGIYIIIFMMIVSTFGYDLPQNTQASIEAIITFFMWFKFLYFLRIFKNTGYLIRMIVEVIIDMKNFFLVLFITIAAFGDAFLRISLYNTYSEVDDRQLTIHYRLYRLPRLHLQNGTWRFRHWCLWRSSSSSCLDSFLDLYCVQHDCHAKLAYCHHFRLICQSCFNFRASYLLRKMQDDIRKQLSYSRQS